MTPGFTGSPLERFNHERDDADATAAHLADWRARLLLLNGLDPVTTSEGALQWGTLADAPPDIDLALLGLIDGRPRFVALDPNARGNAPFAIFDILATMPPGEAATYSVARSLVDWHARHRFCPRCATPTVAFRAGWARKCPSCATEHFPRTDPVVIMLAEHDDAVLLGRQASWPAGRFSALAGFVEVGESIEEAVARELHEESGVTTTSVRYLASQPWPFPSQLMIACVARVTSRDLVLDTNELEQAIWVTREDIRASFVGAPDAKFLPPPPYAIASTLLTRWAAGD